MFQSHSTQPLLPPEQMSFVGQQPQLSSQQLPLAAPVSSRDQLTGPLPSQGSLQQQDTFSQNMFPISHSTQQPRHPSYYPDHPHAPQHTQHNILPAAPSLVSVPGYPLPLAPPTASVDQFVFEQQHPQQHLQQPSYMYSMHHLAYPLAPSMQLGPQQEQQQQQITQSPQQIFPQQQRNHHHHQHHQHHSYQHQRPQQQHVHPHMQVSQSQFSHSTPAYAFTPPLSSVDTWKTFRDSVTAAGSAVPVSEPLQHRPPISGMSSTEAPVLIAPSLPSQQSFVAASSSSMATASPSPMASPPKPHCLDPLQLVAGNVVTHGIPVPSASVGAGSEPHTAAFTGGCDPSTDTLFQTQQQQRQQQQGQIEGMSGCASGIGQLTGFRGGLVVTTATPASVIGGIQGHERDGQVEGCDEVREELSANGAFGSQQPIKGAANKQTGTLGEAQLSLQQQQQQQQQQQLQQTFVPQQHLEQSYFSGQGTQSTQIVQSNQSDEQGHASLFPMTPPLSPGQAQIYHAQTLGQGTAVPLPIVHQQQQETTVLGLSAASPSSSPSSSPLPIAVPTFSTQQPAITAVLMSPTILSTTFSTAMDISASPSDAEAIPTSSTRSRKRASTSASRGKGRKSPPSGAKTRSQKPSQLNIADVSMSILQTMDINQAMVASSSSSPVASSSRSTAQIASMSSPPLFSSMPPPSGSSRSASVSSSASGPSSWPNTSLHALSPLTDPGRQFKCNTCNKRFLRQYNLNAHVKTHSLERNFPCDLCDRAFLRPYDLSRHQRIHSKSRPYQCTICNQDFIRNDAIWRHYRKIHQNHPSVPRSRRDRRSYSVASGTAAVAAEAAAAAAAAAEGDDDEDEEELDSEEDTIRGAEHDDNDDDEEALSPMSLSSSASSLGMTRTVSTGSPGSASAPTTPHPDLMSSSPSPPPHSSSAVRKRTGRK